MSTTEGAVDMGEERPPPDRSAAVRLSARVSRWASYVGAIAIVGILVGTVADVLRRWLTNHPIAGVLEISEVLLVVAVFFGLAYAEERRQHVSTDVITSRLRGRRARVVRLVSRGVLLVFLAATFVATLGRTRRSLSTNEIRQGLIDVPVWPARLAITVGLGLLLIHVVLTIRERLRRPARDDESDGSPPALGGMS